MKKKVNGIGFAVLGLGLYVLYILLIPPTNLAYPIAYVEVGAEKVEMLPLYVSWINVLR